MEPFENALARKAEAVEQWKTDRGGKVIGFLLTDVPEELIHAAGFFPYGIVGGSTNLEEANTHLQAWACSYSRSSLARALEGKLDFLDGLIIPQTCDTMRMLLDLWQQIHPLPYMENFRLPRQVDRSSARKYLLGELKRIKKGLEEFRGAPIEAESLRQSINLYNHNRQLLRKIFHLHARRPDLLSSRQLYTIINGTMIMAREKANRLLQPIAEKLEQNLEDAGNGSRIRLLMSGTLLEPFEVLDFIEEFGGTVVADDFQNGFRYIEADIDPDRDPLEALAERQLMRIPSAAFDLGKRPRRVFLNELAREKEARGAILLHHTFCEPENFDGYDNLQALQNQDIPAMRIETQFGGAGLGQIRTRVHAFMEMVGGVIR